MGRWDKMGQDGTGRWLEEASSPPRHKSGCYGWMVLAGLLACLAQIESQAGLIHEYGRYSTILCLSAASVAGCLTDRAWVNVPSRSMGQASCRSADVPHYDEVYIRYHQPEEEANTDDGDEASNNNNQ
ncbi:hypothetical protein TMEN_3324 [Trichophyton mentagrophytes]|nr:hypothetical protein TMEN_3324 [Trichophyton mentagrophytes]